jgi:hypothetical protein
MIPTREKTSHMKGRPMDREEALAHVGKRMQTTKRLYRDVPAGTTGTVVHANLAHRFCDPDYGHTDLYELVVAWDLPLPIVTTMDEAEYAGLELA